MVNVGGFVVVLFLQMHDFSEVGMNWFPVFVLQMHDFSEVGMSLEYFMFCM
jgi:hypothetical protein